jgi:undecaprenyl diphosphate synthase
MMSANMYANYVDDPELIIRTGGEIRTSNFLLWQSAYSEYVFMDDILWPDFTTDNLEEAIDEYCKRNRRYGGV